LGYTKCVENFPEATDQALFKQLNVGSDWSPKALIERPPSPERRRSLYVGGHLKCSSVCEVDINRRGHTLHLGWSTHDVGVGSNGGLDCNTQSLIIYWGGNSLAIEDVLTVNISLLSPLSPAIPSHITYQLHNLPAWIHESGWYSSCDLSQHGGPKTSKTHIILNNIPVRLGTPAVLIKLDGRGLTLGVVEMHNVAVVLEEVDFLNPRDGIHSQPLERAL
jgi:hypothetical protein